MFPKFWTKKTKVGTMETTGGDRVIKPLIGVALVVVFLAGCIISRSQDPRVDDDRYKLFKSYNGPKSLGDILYEYIHDVVSVPLIATVFFCWVCGSLADEHGRIGAMQLFFVLAGTGFGFLIFAQDYDFSLLGSFILGAALGCSVPAPIYIAELSPVRHRSFLLALVPIALSLGIFSMDIIESRGAETTAWKAFCWTSAVGFFLTLFLHEAPEWLVLKNRPDAALESLKWVKETTADIDTDLRKLQELSISRNERSDSTLEALFQKKVWKPFAMVLGLALFQHLAGFYLMLYEAPYLVNQYRTDVYFFSTYTGTDFMVLAASVVALVFQANMSRRAVAVLSGVSSALAILGLFLHAHWLPPDAPWRLPEKEMLTPVFFFTLYLISVVMGIYTLPWILIFEIFPLRYRAVLCGVSFSVMYLGLFFYATKFNYYLLESLVLQQMLCLFGICSLGFAIYARSILVETHKKSFDEIERSFTKERIFLPTDEKI